MRIDNLYDQKQREKILQQIELTKDSIRQSHKRLETLKKLVCAPYKADASDAQSKLGHALEHLSLISEWAKTVETEGK
jgi:hypothetical protein